MPEELVVADIQQAFFEHRANFKEPITVLWSGGRQAEIIDAMHKALAPWDVGVENIVWNQGARSLREVQLTFGVPSLAASIAVGVVGTTMTALNLDWSRAPTLVSMFQAGTDALTGITGQHLQSHQTTLGFHVKPPEARPFRKTVAQFVNPEALGSNDAAMFGVSVYYEDRSFVFDASAVVHGGLFVKLIRNFDSEKRFDEMAKTIHSDEERALRQLGLKLK
jgi:hypothetical protein